MAIHYQASKARVNFGAIINQVSSNSEEVIIERLGQPIVRISPYIKNRSIDELRRRINNFRTKNDAFDSSRVVRKERDRK